MEKCFTIVKKCLKNYSKSKRITVYKFNENDTEIYDKSRQIIINALTYLPNNSKYVLFVTYAQKDYDSLSSILKDFDVDV